VYAMLAKAPDGRPETAQHVADRAEVIREARRRSGYAGPVTASLPVVPNFPPPDSNDFYNNGNDFYNDDQGWSADPRPRRRALALAGAGLAACGLIAIIVLLLTSSTTPASGVAKKLEHTKSPTQTAGRATSPITGSLPATPAGGFPGRTNLGTATKNPNATHRGRPTTSAKQSSTPTQSSPATSTFSSPPATISNSAPPTGSAPSSTPPSSPASPPSSPASPPSSPASPPSSPDPGSAATPDVGTRG
jgi:hypothetical protein